MATLPPPNRVPTPASERAATMAHGYIVATWGIDPPPEPPTEVHMVISAPGIQPAIVMRLTDAGKVDTLIAALRHHRANVWPSHQEEA